jgi:hypothetical protein
MYPSDRGWVLRLRRLRRPARRIARQARLHPDEPVGAFHTFDVSHVNGPGEVIGGARILALKTE